MIRERELIIRLAVALALSTVCVLVLVCFRSRRAEGTNGTRSARGGRHQRLPTAEDDDGMDGIEDGETKGRPEKRRKTGRITAGGDQNDPKPAEKGALPSKKSLRVLLADEDLIALTRFEHSTEI